MTQSPQEQGWRCGPDTSLPRGRSARGRLAHLHRAVQLGCLDVDLVRGAHGAAWGMCSAHTLIIDKVPRQQHAEKFPASASSLQGRGPHQQAGAS